MEEKEIDIEELQKKLSKEYQKQLEEKGMLEELEFVREFEKKGIFLLGVDMDFDDDIDEKINIRLPDKKYFHKTRYATLFKENFGEELKPNNLQFDLSFNTLRTSVKFYLQLVNYKQNKIERHKAIKSVLEEYNNKIKKNIHKCYDKYCIELSYEFEKWYDELLQMEEKNKYNYKSLEKEVKKYILDIINNQWLSLDTRLNKKTNFNGNINYKVIREKNVDDKIGFGVDYHSDFLMRFKKKYKQKLHLKEYSFVMDTLYVITYIYKYVSNIEKVKIGIDAYFNDYTQKIKINDDFDTNYDIINLISKTNDINTIKTLITSLIAKNIYFLENDRSVIKIEED